MRLLLDICSWVYKHTYIQNSISTKSITCKQFLCFTSGSTLHAGGVPWLHSYPNLGRTLKNARKLQMVNGWLATYDCDYTADRVVERGSIFGVQRTSGSALQPCSGLPSPRPWRSRDICQVSVFNTYLGFCCTIFLCFVTPGWQPDL